MTLRILFITHEVPYPVRYGGQVYTGNMIRHLSSHEDVELSVLSYGSSLDGVPDLRDAKWLLVPRPRLSMAALASSRLPLIALRHKSKQFERAALAMIESARPDYVILDYLAVGWLVGPLSRSARERGTPRLIYMSHNVEGRLRRDIARGLSQRPKIVRLAAQVDQRRAGRLERRLLEGCSLTTTETAEDLQEFAAAFPGTRLLTVPPGYTGPVERERRMPSSTSERAVLILGGRLSTMKQAVLDSLLESIARPLRDLDISVHVVGPMTDGYQQKCRARFPDVQFHGFVEDLGPLLGRVRIGIIADHIGGGFKHRVVHHVFQRIPIVANPDSMAGLPLTAQTDYLSVDDYDQVPSVVAGAIDDIDLLRRVQDSAFRACEGLFSWDATADGFVAALGKQRAAQ